MVNKPNPKECVPTAVQSCSGLLKNDLSQWKLNDFVFRFYNKYAEATGVPHIRSMRKDMALMKGILAYFDNEKDTLLKAINAYFEMGYNNPCLANFRYSARLMEVKEYMQNKTLPYFLSKNKTENSLEFHAAQEREDIQEQNNDKFYEIFGGGDNE